MILEAFEMMGMHLYPHRTATLARSVIAADYSRSPLVLLIGAIGMPAFPIRVALSSRVAPFDAARMRTEPLIDEERNCTGLPLGKLLTAILTNLSPVSANPAPVLFAYGRDAHSSSMALRVKA